VVGNGPGACVPGFPFRFVPDMVRGAGRQERTGDKRRQVRHLFVVKSLTSGLDIRNLDSSPSTIKLPAVLSTGKAVPVVMKKSGVGAKIRHAMMNLSIADSLKPTSTMNISSPRNRFSYHGAQSRHHVFDLKHRIASSHQCAQQQEIIGFRGRQTIEIALKDRFPIDAIGVETMVHQNGRFIHSSKHQNSVPHNAQLLASGLDRLLRQLLYEFAVQMQEPTPKPSIGGQEFFRRFLHFVLT